MLTVSTNSTERQMPETSLCITPTRLYEQAPLNPEIGDIIPVRIMRYNSENGMIFCSGENTELNYIIRYTNYIYPNNGEIALLKAIRGNLGKKVIAKVVAKYENGTIELDRAQILKQTTEILANKISKNVMATIEKIVEYGAFIDIGNGVNALLHITNISKSRCYAISDLFKIGDVITVKLMDFDSKTSFFTVSRKDAYPRIMFDKGEIILVKVMQQLDSEGYFVEYDPGNIGIMDVTNNMILREGQKVLCKVKSNKEQGFKCIFTDYND